MSCSGSGKSVLKKDCWNSRRKNAPWSGEGWRTSCPDCGKVCAVGPVSHKIQKHSPAKSKAKRMSAAEKKLARLVLLDLTYSGIYDLGLHGESARPNAGLDYELRQVWEMAYLDGLGDGGHNMKAGAFKRWLAKN